MISKPKRHPKKSRPPNPLKVQRLVDPDAIEAARKPYSEISGEPTYGAAPHHIYPVGSGGPDHRFNLIQTTGNEHIKCHNGEYDKEFLLTIVAERESVTVDYVITTINNTRRGIYADDSI